MARVVQLYFDDSGSRHRDHRSPQSQAMRDYFALGGISVEAREVGRIWEVYRRFRSSWSIESPLRSHDIRNRRGGFAWLRRRSPEDRARFLLELEKFIGALPVIVIACVIDRPGYNERYERLYGDRRWILCKTAFAVLIERAAKHAERTASKLEIYFERSGNTEDRAIEGYLKDLKKNGMPFARDTSGKYAPLDGADFRRIVLGDPNRVTKDLPMCQIPDLCLHSVATAGYERDHKPYMILRKQGKLIDCRITDEQVPHLGIKYSCFEGRED